MIETVAIIVALLAVGLLLLLAEAFLPTYGVLGIMGLAAGVAAVWLTFRVNSWAAAGLALGMAIASPFVFTWMMRIWPKTPVGRRMVLNHSDPNPRRQAMALGAVGVTMTELRPMGECEFGEVRLEAMAERGMIPAGTTVKVVSMGESMPIVRQMTA